MRTFVAGAIQLHVLHHASKHEIHGAWMTAELARHGHTVDSGTLYPALHRMEAAGLLTSRDSTLNGRRVRYYTITDTGRTELTTNRDILQQLADDLLATPLKPLSPTTRERPPPRPLDIRGTLTTQRPGSAL